MKKRDTLFWAGVGFLFLVLLFAVFGPHIRHDHLTQGDTIHDLPNAKHWLGTDELGRDIFARLAYGGRLSLMIGLTVQTFAITFGIIMGAVGVFAPSWIRTPVLRFTDAMFAFPDLLIALLIIGLWSPGVIPVMVALSITSWPGMARLVRSQLVSLKDREYVIAARAAGASTTYVVMRHILPQMIGIILAVAMIDLAGTILSESTLSFIGIGIQPPTPSWGAMINNARGEMQSHPVPLIWPCLVLSMTIFALNFVGDGLRARLDPKSGRT
ncbi:MAG: ABC transporter permease [Fimbriimonadaceae bacterium]